jgi:hypothetical protein
MTKKPTWSNVGLATCEGVRMTQQAPTNDDPATAGVSRLALGALQALRAAGTLLEDAGHTLGGESGSEELHDVVNAVTERIPRIDPTSDGVADIAFVACEVLHLCEVLANKHRRPSPSAFGAARLAETAAELALEAITEDPRWSSTEALSRRARQVGEIHELQDRVDEIVEIIERHGLGGTPAARSLRGEVRIAIACADPHPPHG